MHLAKVLLSFLQVREKHTGLLTEVWYGNNPFVLFWLIAVAYFVRVPLNKTVFSVNSWKRNSLRMNK